LADREWAEVARELLDGTGVAARGDARGPRWVAIRRADDHIHVAVVVVRQDNGQRVWPRQLCAVADGRASNRAGARLSGNADRGAGRHRGSSAASGEAEKARR
jgi:hypothetical protein